MTTPNHFDTDVLIVGAGPTGLALATTLSRAGIRPIVVERLAAHQNTSRAAVIHAHTLEQLDGLGVSGPMLQEGLCLSRFSVRDRDQVLARLNFDWLPSRFACLLMLPQDRTEAILTNALEQAKTTVRWGCSLESLRVSEDGVEAIVSSAAGTKTLRARYVVGADGMHSRVRQAAGIGFSGHSYEQSFILADVEMDWKPGRDEVMLFFSPDGLLVVAPLPGNAYRVVASVDEAPATPEASDIEQILRRRGPASSGASVQTVRWSSHFRLHHRVADHYRHGRLLLVGDAAHVHSPAGGQGMNTGLVDACVLGKLLTQALSQRVHADPLDSYEAMRRPAAKEVLALAGRLTTMAIVKGTFRRFLRNLAFRLLGALPPLRRRLELSLSGLSRRAAAVLPASRSTAVREMPREAAL
jgi:2-polyprenyl-6-methoxyphenol hydroxylase-like FAD-dependent oxidoreductase